MAKSLQEQLLAAGAIKKDQATRLKKAKHKQDKQRARGAAVAEQDKTSARQAQAEKARRDRDLNRQQQAVAEDKARHAALQQLLDHNVVAPGSGECTYHYVDKGAIRSIDLGAEQHAALSSGRLALVRGGNASVLVAAALADRVRNHVADAILVLNDPAIDDVDTDDPYAAFQVPDDLSW